MLTWCCRIAPRVSACSYLLPLGGGGDPARAQRLAGPRGRVARRLQRELAAPRAHAAALEYPDITNHVNISAHIK